MKSEIQSKERIFGLDVVRALAILFVLGAHLFYVIDDYSPILLSISGVFGYFGVDLFFVLSGFLIGSILLKSFLKTSFGLRGIRYFLKRRWFRTLPAYYLVVLLNGILAIVFHYDFSNWWKYLFFIQNFSYYDISLFKESWSLSVEEWVYVSLPMVLLIGAKFLKLSRKWLFLLLTVVLIIVAHICRWYAYQYIEIPDLQTWNLAIKSTVIYRFDTILFGFLVAWLYYFYPKKLRKIRVYLLILTPYLFIVQFFVLNVLRVEFYTSQLYFKVFYFTFTAVTISLGLPFFVYWRTAHPIVSKPIEWISKISYSIYLLHYSIVALVLKYGLSFLPFSLSKGVIILLYIFTTFVLSYILYRFFEKPITNLRDKF